MDARPAHLPPPPRCRTLVRRIKRTARLWVRMQATVPVTKKPLGIRMGKGKGAIEFYACAVRPGQVSRPRQPTGGASATRV